ncbi:tyrosine-type recombinase/integrase [Frigoriglobus tundricola]|uniref:Uncharacterized protein n=1 Tax=Frigoriglobus tundricola TaxID=2774151 RepID=A0A6M5YGH5_9BACT|nr:tyrosine-type recombinase/integrase [Frigoriglobus tundricola]QJW93149.1 hypothetical protein FTUN_0654 [Frigoriglobus tundricola]
MPRPKNEVPVYKHHKSTGLARCWVNGRWVSLGKYGSAESKAEFERILAELRSGVPATSVAVASESLTVDQILLVFLKHANEHYRRADSTPTDQVVEYKRALAPVHKIYGHVPAMEFGPLALKTVRKAYIDAGICRTLINSRIGKVKRVFKWAVSEQLVPVAVYTALATVEGLKEGRTSVRESEPVRPVDPAVVEATLARLNRHVRGLVEFQRLTACRPGEAMSLRQCDIDMTGDVWLYRPPQHKTKHKGKKRTIAIGPKGQELIKGFFTENASDYLFSPSRAAEEYQAARAANRKTPLYPSHVKSNASRRVGANRKRKPRERYGRQSYLTAIERACDRAFPLPADLARKRKDNGRMETPAEWRKRLSADERERVKAWREKHQWFPYQLRHTAATEIRRRHGLESAQVALGHAHAKTSEIYAEKNEGLAAKVAAEIG